MEAATAPRPALKDLMAVSGTGQLKALGYLTWFSVPDEPVGLRSLKMKLAANGLPPKLAPKDTKAINTFKRAVRELDGKHRENGHIRENDVALVAETPINCVYQVSTLIRNLEDQVVNYPKALRVIFNKETEDIRMNPLAEVKRSEVLPLMEAIEDFYEQNSSKVTGAKVRTIVRNYLRSEPDEQRDIDGLSGENLRGRSGGIYFIPAKHGDQLRNLADMLAELYPDDRAYLHMVPLADTASEREIIRRHHIANAREELKEAIAEAKALNSSDRERRARSDVVANQYARMHAIRRRAAQYATLLEEDTEEITEMGEILKKQLDRLI